VFRVFVTQTAYSSRVPAKESVFFAPFALSDQQKAPARLLARISYTIGIMSESNGTVPMDDDRGLFSPENVETPLQPTNGDDISEGHEDHDAESVIVVGEQEIEALERNLALSQQFEQSCSQNEQQTMPNDSSAATSDQPMDISRGRLRTRRPNTLTTSKRSCSLQKQQLLTL